MVWVVWKGGGIWMINHANISRRGRCALPAKYRNDSPPVAPPNPRMPKRIMRTTSPRLALSIPTLQTNSKRPLTNRMNLHETSKNAALNLPPPSHAILHKLHKAFIQPSCLIRTQSPMEARPPAFQRCIKRELTHKQHVGVRVCDGHAVTHQCG